MNRMDATALIRQPLQHRSVAFPHFLDGRFDPVGTDPDVRRRHDRRLPLIVIWRGVSSVMPIACITGFSMMSATLFRVFEAS